MTIDFAQLRQTYRDLLLNGIAPFWLRYGIDREHGGVLSCMSEDGQVLSGDKYLWSQARSVWTFSALYNRIEPRPEFLEAARNSVRFLLAHGRDSAGDFVYHTDRAGTVVEGAISIYTDCFAVYGLSEFYRAVRDPEILATAQAIFDRVLERIARPGFAETAPYRLPPGRIAHGVSMILTEVANELFATSGRTDLEEVITGSVDAVMNHFLRPDRQLLVEFLTTEREELPPPEGTAVVPGHAIESMWFVLHVAHRRQDRNLVRRATECIRRHLEAGWDPEWGGLFLAIDAEGHAPFWQGAAKKLWWPHTEALYALLLSHRLTGEEWCLEWYRRVHEWAFAHFPLAGTGEWQQRLTREGHPSTELVALPVKDPFHLPRAAILIAQLLGGSGPTGDAGAVS